MKVLLLAVLVFVTATAEESQVLKDYAIGQTQFTANVYKELLKSNSGNFVVCPLSVDIILALLHEGAKGNTAQQISQGLHLPENKEDIQKIIRELIPHLKEGEKFTLSSANKIYLQNGIKINEEYKNTAVDVYGSEIENIDFSNAAQAASEINKWVEDQTHEKIKNLLDSKDLGASTHAVLVNALYFKSKWENPFNVNSTAKKVFHLNNNDQVEIDMMQQIGQFRYYESAEFKAKFLEMPYKGHEVTMTIVLPDEVEGLSALEEHLTDVLVTPQYKPEHVRVMVPLFKTETTIEFKPILEAMGIVDVFGPSADLTGITDDHEKLIVDKVVQKAFIEVNEKGTTAGAATAVTSKLGGMLGARTRFIADHPFIYYLRSPAGILFVGRYIKE